MNMFKKNGGFTLVELIVVIAILAILAGIAVPAYSGYITKAKEAADITALDAVKTAAQAALATKGAIDELDVTSNGAVTAKIGNDEYKLSEAKDDVTYDDDFKTFNNGSANAPALEVTASANWKGGTWTLVPQA